MESEASKYGTGHMATFLSVLCWVGWTLPLRGWWEGMALWRQRAGASVAAVIVSIEYCRVRSFGPLHGWEMTCLYLPGTLSVSTWLSGPFLNTSCHDLLTFCAQSLKSPAKRPATQLHCLVTCCVWSMMLSRDTAGAFPRKSPVPSARGPPNWLGLVWQIGGSYHVKLFRASCLSVIQYFWHCLLTLVCRGKLPSAWGKVWPNVWE